MFEPTGSLWAGVGRNRPCSSLVDLSPRLWWFGRSYACSSRHADLHPEPDKFHPGVILVPVSGLFEWYQSQVVCAFFPDEKQSYQTFWTKTEVLGERDKKSLVFGPTNALADNKSNCKFYTERILSRFLCGIIFFFCLFSSLLVSQHLCQDIKYPPNSFQTLWGSSIRKIKTAESGKKHRSHHAGSHSVPGVLRDEPVTSH